MTTPLYLVEPAALDAVSPQDALRLDGPEGHHAAVVRRTRAGEPLDVADGQGLVARCTVEAVEGATLSLRVQRLDHLARAVPEFVLVQALAKGGRDELAIETATELGVDAIIPWQARRSVVQWAGERGRRAHAKWEGVVRAAAKQSRRPRIPEVLSALDSTRLSEQILARTTAGDVVLILDAEARTALAGYEPQPGCGQLWLIVGPEGGIEPSELAAFTDAGALPVRLGQGVLRSSSAGPAAIAVLSAASRWRERTGTC